MGFQELFVAAFARMLVIAGAVYCLYAVVVVAIARSIGAKRVGGMEAAWLIISGVYVTPIWRNSALVSDDFFALSGIAVIVASNAWITHAFWRMYKDGWHPATVVLILLAILLPGLFVVAAIAEAEVFINPIMR